MTTAVVIPFRDRGTDPLRALNLARVYRHWDGYAAADALIVAHDGDGINAAAQFNRSAAYNRGIEAAPDADVYVFAESDMLVDYRQVDRAVELARENAGLVVPFTRYQYLDVPNSVRVRGGVKPETCTPAWTMDDGRSIGAINVVSRATMAAVGRWDETFTGAWFDDNAMAQAFTVCTAPIRWVDGPAWHLYHLPGTRGAHLTAADRAATARNRARYELYRQAVTPERIRELTGGTPG